MNFFFLVSLIALILGYLIMEKREPGIMGRWFFGSRPLIAIHYLLPTTFGVFLGSYIFQEPVNYLKTVSLLSTIFFSFQTSVVTNDFNDLRTDRIAEKKSLLNSSSHAIKNIEALGSYFLMISVFFALSISYQILLIVLLGHILHFTYSAKPLRLKRFFPVSIMMLAMGALLTAIAGFALFEPSKPFLAFPPKVALFIFIPLFLALNFRDLADYHGDRKTEVITLFTILGQKRGRYINAFLVLMSYLSIPVILQFPLLFIVTLPLGILSVYFCLKHPFEEKYIFYIYFVLVAILAIIFKINPAIIAPKLGYY